ncbi:MAG: hypothetical protein ACOCUT_00105 [bacterium]
MAIKANDKFVAYNFPNGYTEQAMESFKKLNYNSFDPSWRFTKHEVSILLPETQRDRFEANQLQNPAIWGMKKVHS